MKKILTIGMAVIILLVGLCGCTSGERKYVKLIDTYTQERYSVGIEKGQDTYVKIVKGEEDGIEAYVYCGNGLMFKVKQGAIEAMNNGESVLHYVESYFPGKPGYEQPTEEELKTEWSKFKS